MKRSILTLLIGLMLASCTSELTDGDFSGAISGSVSDNVTGEPVPVVNVILYSLDYYGDEYYGDEYYGDEYYDDEYYEEDYGHVSRSTVTGSDGSFSFDDLEAGEYMLEINKTNYKSNYKTVRVENGKTAVAHMLIERMPAIVTTDRTELDFGSDKSNNTLSFNIVNSSYENLDWSIEKNCSWIKEVKPSSGTLGFGKTETIVVVIDREKLEEVDNHTVIVVRSSNGSSEVNVYAIGEYTSMPTLETYAATNVGAYSATLNGKITDAGTPEYAERGFVYSTSSYPTIENSTRVTVPKNSTSEFSYSIGNLTLGETYYVRAYATSSKGTAYSSYDVSFTTAATYAQVTTLEITDADMAEGTATFRGKIGHAGEPAYYERGFVYSTMPEPTVNDNKIVKDGTGTGNFSSYVTGLPKNKAYYVRAYAISEAGVAYGNEVEVRPDFIVLTAAKLMVQTKDLGCTDWHTAITMCESSIVGGYTDWRLPTREELMVLYNNKEKIGGFKLGETDNNSNTYEWYYWSSTYDGAYYSINFSSGKITSDSHNYRNSVRAVRSIE